MDAWMGNLISSTIFKYGSGSSFSIVSVLDLINGFLSVYCLSEWRLGVAPADNLFPHSIY